ncbi:MAG: DUF2207 domain-containing protein, partial [Armatimonadota bacterium]|nr:DUF2207 domain-containing protein [Armatimonadota bacterium]
MKRAVFAFLMFVACACALAQGFVIDRFDVDVQLRKDGSATFTEKIAVTFSEEKHGIYRDIPIDYYLENKRVTRSIDIWNINVQDGSGQEIETKISRNGGNLNIRIGSADITLPAGTQITYVISYKAKGFMNWFGDDKWGESAEFYWNLTGDEWLAPINQATFRVSFPEAKDGKGLRARVFVGPYGARDYMGLEKPQHGLFDETLQTSLSLTPNSVSGARLTPLPMYQGVTLVLGLPAALVEKPGWFETLWTFLRPNLGFAIPIIVFPLCYFAWLKLGRDPDGGPMVVRYDPPESLSASSAGFMTDESVDPHDLSAVMVALAVKGYINFESEGTGGLLSPRKVTIVMKTDRPDGKDLSP